MTLSNQVQTVRGTEPIVSLLKKIEVQQSLKVGATTVHKLSKAGLLTPIRFSKRIVRYSATEVEALVKAVTKSGGEK